MGALAAGVSGYALYLLTRRLLERLGATSRLDPALSLTAALTATLSPTWQAECAAPGGIALSAALGLVVLAMADARDHHFGSSLGVGAVFGLAFAESRLPAAVTAAALAVRVIASGVVPDRRRAAVFALGAVSVWLFFLLPLVVRPHAENVWVSLGPGLSGVDEPARIAVRLRQGPFAAWAAQMGVMATALGVTGLAWGAARRPLRVATLPAALFVAADCFLPTREGGALSADPVLGVRLLAVAALAMGAALGVRSAVATLEKLRIPFASSAAVLLVVYHFTLVFMAEETSADVVSVSDHLAADVWADEALGELPPNSLLLVRSPTLAWRLWAARIAHGERPDIVIVPLGLLGRGSMARALCDEEPALTPLVRDVAMTGRTSEFALSSVADARPLYVEFDPDWDRALLSHLRPTPLWLGFASHTLGRSDRVRAFSDESGRRAFRRVLGAARDRGRDDSATLAVLGAEVREHAVVLAALGDREAARQALQDLARTDADAAFVKKLTAQMDAGGRIDTRLLLE